MSIKLLDVTVESCPAARLIGKRYEGIPNWGEWWENDWFSVLEPTPALPFNGDAYLGAVRVVDGRPERWIGMLFPAGTDVPEGFASVEIPPLSYAVCYMQGPEGSGDFFALDTHSMCLQALTARSLQRKEDHWCLERYNCPRWTTPDASGNVILDYAISIEA